MVIPGDQRKMEKTEKQIDPDYTIAKDDDFAFDAICEDIAKNASFFRDSQEVMGYGGGSWDEETWEAKPVKEELLIDCTNDSYVPMSFTVSDVIPVAGVDDDVQICWLFRLSSVHLESNVKGKTGERYIAYYEYMG